METLNPGQIFKQLYIQFLSLFTGYSTGIETLTQAEADLRGIERTGHDSYQLVFPWSSYDQGKVIKSKINNVFSRLMWAAAKEFAPSRHTPLKIDEGQFGERFRDPILKSEDWAAFDPEAIWAALEAEYGGQKGEDEAFRQSAIKIIDKFNIRGGQPLEIRQGGPVLHKSVWVDDFAKKHYGRNELSTGCRDGIMECLFGLTSFALWAGDAITANALTRYRDGLWNNRDRSITSREKTKLGSLTLTTYNTRFEFHFSKELGDSLQIFLSTYALAKLQAAA